MEALNKLLGGEARVKTMRLFLANPEQVFTLREAAKSLRVSRPKIRRELKFLNSAGFIKKGIKKIEKKREPGFVLNPFFPFARQFRALVVEAASISREIIARRFKRLGKGLRLVLLSGVFIDRATPGHIDILMVGDNIKRSKVEKILGKIEAELGKELNYALFDTKEFKYRQGMYDRFILDILESEHDILINNQGAPR
ncbi:hypothetical protein A2757_02690 [Candidatus Giovannonibacteria bacterium RIFCSPHIGHO2_01_FULL_48_47]|nr:MAG: hypothetical protein A2757_02690 [Candidatus Giovannonibacteria bacterium RIFCSPHIGHO2_01_FULL_48_47]OGF69054.1 MAG: hypothetical protein A3D61_03395 [Candidatus Giovannonibacteria bacterium RIFCSPHIGHO2_02_FULL_48_15]OGF87968.1 MAG: hypothetical protein A3B26_03690 [Candidatus Giovannonibacteria bacterium RIFCSPLOWO2_01_FULL_48_47]OGF95110.1 MAG: hypothetical protein A2433_03125 [Candidatus Giovannonibacteria bacterium RIFOXYC1_FULL_48_8]OGF95822.1 MAG: hypothetical protein A2613_03300